MPTPRRPTDSELEILTVLWSTGPATVREVHAVISRRRAAEYATVLKFLQIMAEKGLVRRNEKQRAHVYEAARPREWTHKQLAGDLLERAFNGSAEAHPSQLTGIWRRSIRCWWWSTISSVF